MRILILIFLLLPSFSYAQTSKDAFRSTPYPLPRFVSLRSSEVFARTGPGKQYPIRYVYKRKNLPVEITLEYESWRKIRDSQGAEGWVHKSLLSGKRTAIVQQDGYIVKSPKAQASKKAALESGVIMLVEECKKSWCKVRTGSYHGWIPQTQLWGVYPAERID